jgi:DNA gyrase/topoisomerase IV subunit A
MLNYTRQQVAQLAGYVSEKTAYHHGEVSLTMTIVGLAQDYVGSNNINLLEPSGQFGTRNAVRNKKQRSMKRRLIATTADREAKTQPALVIFSPTFPALQGQSSTRTMIPS